MYLEAILICSVHYPNPLPAHSDRDAELQTSLVFEGQAVTQSSVSHPLTQTQTAATKLSHQAQLAMRHFHLPRTFKEYSLILALGLTTPSPRSLSSLGV